MCIVAVAHLVTGRYPLIVAANRDERHDRHSAAARWWADAPQLLAGRDLVAGGTWLGVTSAGRFAAVTNVSDGSRRPGRHSRGMLVRDFLLGNIDADLYGRQVTAAGALYGPFNLLLHESGRLHLASNRRAPVELGPGIHVFSNNRAGTDDWPKSDQLRRMVAAALESPAPEWVLLEQLGTPATRGSLAAAPDSIFIVGEDFGTRCSSVLTVDARGRARFLERRFSADGAAAGTSEFEFSVGSASGR